MTGRPNPIPPTPECPAGGRHEPTTMEGKEGDVHIKWTACKKCNQRM